MSLTATLDAPLAGVLDETDTSSPSLLSGEVPGRFDVAVDGRAYMIDYAADLQGFRGQHLSRSSVPALRSQADTATVPAEQSINRESLWRRSHESWHHGSGQVYFDRADSDAARFHASKGVDVWNKWTLSLLNDVTLARASAATNLRLTSAGDYTYLADGNDLLFSSDLTSPTPAFTTVTGTPASPCNWVTTDGYTVYAAFGVDVYSTTRGAAAAAPFSTAYPTDVTVLGYVKGRLMAAAGPAIYNITASGAAPSELLDHPNSDFTWVGFAEGPGFIYAAGHSGARSLIYKIGVTADATSLDAPIVAGELPTGETVRTIKGYLGVLLVGTDVGFRCASIDGSGFLTFGSLIPTASAVLNFEPADRFVWYGLTDYDATSTGLGRMDLSEFPNQPLTPAYASDLMASGQGAVLSISSVGTRRVFAVSGLGVYVQSPDLVTEGTLTSGRITYGVGDDKIAMFLDLRHQPLAGEVVVTLIADDTAETDLGSSATADSVRSAYPLNAQQTRAEFFELELRLIAASVSEGPSVTRTTLRAYAAPSRTITQIVPLLLHAEVNTLNNQSRSYDVEAERAFLENLVITQQLVTFQKGSTSRTVVPVDFDWLPVKRGGKPGWSDDGTFVLTMKEQSQ